MLPIRCDVSAPTPQGLIGVPGPPRVKAESTFPSPAMDFHAGVGETSWMLYLTPQLVDMEKAAPPMLKLTLTSINLDPKSTLSEAVFSVPVPEPSA